MATVVLTAGFVADATGGRLVAGAADRVFAAVSTDSRTLRAGALFVALKGARFDGHDHVAQAVAHGAAGLLVSHPVRANDAVAVIEVADTLAALQQLGRTIRDHSGANVIAITGSAGKTTTKEIAADVLATRYRVYRNRGNLNNHIGLPLSLTELASGPEIAVVELGMNHAGEIRELVRMAQPDTRIWTNVGDAHIGFFGSREAIARAKAELLEQAGPETLLIANADDPLVMEYARGFAGRTVTFGATPAADVRAVMIDARGFDGTTVVVETRRGALRLSIQLPGLAHVMNVLATVAVGVEYGIGLDAITSTVAMAKPVAHRGSVHTLKNRARLVDDSYNASPAAVAAMLRTLAATPCNGKRIAVLGEMRELGDQALALHEQTGRTAVESDVDRLVAVGGAAANGLVTGALSAGMPPAHVFRFDESSQAGEPVAALIQTGDIVLVKGSRGTRTDLIVDAVMAAEGQG